MAACLLARLETTNITVFERHWDLCAIQQGADNRWLHPHIYDWPSPGSSSPNSKLPLLGWQAGRASDVASQIISKFTEVCETNGRDKRLKLVLGLKHLRVSVVQRTIDWMGSVSARHGAYFRPKYSEGKKEKFDAVIFATGFGIEKQNKKYPTPSYWRNEQIGQHDLYEQNARYIVSGYGDGALVDLCRLTIERYRQDKILDELFSPERRSSQTLKLTGETISAAREAWGGGSMREFFESIEDDLLQEPLKNLKRRIRKDVEVTWHLSGKAGEDGSMEKVFDANTAFGNRLCAYLLYRCGAYSTNFESLPEAVRSSAVGSRSVICRHGAETIQNLKRAIVDFDTVSERLEKMNADQLQSAIELFEPGTFPV